jgi:hypothetical protein
MVLSSQNGYSDRALARRTTGASVYSTNWRSVARGVGY